MLRGAQRFPSEVEELADSRALAADFARHEACLSAHDPPQREQQEERFVGGTDIAATPYVYCPDPA